MTDTPILKVEGIDLDFGDFRALHQVDLTVRPAERVAVLGHNGAGKSTLFKAILGFLRATAGTIEICGSRPGSDAARVAVNYLPENVAFHRNLTGTEVLRYFAGLRRAPRSEVETLLEKVGLGPAAKRPVGTYSKGMRQRLGLAQALVGAPRLLLLDEPTSGLDPISRRDFYQIIADAAGRGCAVLLSSHGLEEIETRVDRVAILSKGRIQADGTLEALAAQASLPVRIRATATADTVSDLHSQFGGQRINGASIELYCSVAGKLDLMSRLIAAGPLVRDITIEEPSLTELYRHFSANSATGGAGKCLS